MSGTAFRDGDVAALFALDFGVPVTIGGTPGRGIVTPNDQVIVTNNGRGEVVGNVTTLAVQKSAFPPITNGMTVVTPDGNFTVRQLVAEQDAAQVKFTLGSV